MVRFRHGVPFLFDNIGNYIMNALQEKSLRDSVKVWYKKCEDLDQATLGITECPCCQEFYNYDVNEKYHCEGCPIKEYTGKRYCDRTPYYGAVIEFKKYNLDNPYGALEDIQHAFALEYNWLLDLSIGKSPEIYPDPWSRRWMNWWKCQLNVLP